MKNIYISSLLTDNKALHLIIDDLKKSLMNVNSLILFMPSSREYYQGQTEWESDFIDSLMKHGIRFESSYSLTSDDEAAVWKQKVKQASLIYLHGGNPLVQKQLYLDQGVYEDLKNFKGVLLGASAGAMNMSQNIILTPTNQEYQDLVVEPALARSEVSIYPHINHSGVLYRYYMTGDGLVDLQDILNLSTHKSISILADGQFIITDEKVREVNGPLFHATDGTMTINGFSMNLGWQYAQDESQLVDDGSEKIVLSRQLDSLADGYLQRLFKARLEDDIAQHDVKILAMAAPCTIVKQYETANRAAFIIFHPHLKTCQIVYDMSNGIEETMSFETKFTRLIDRLKVLPRIEFA